MREEREQLLFTGDHSFEPVNTGFHLGITDQGMKCFRGAQNEK
jgi:hypothetical protein